MTCSPDGLVAETICDQERLPGHVGRFPPIVANQVARNGATRSVGQFWPIRYAMYWDSSLSRSDRKRFCYDFRASVEIRVALFLPAG